MNFRASLMACAVGSALIALPLSTMACSTVIVGKDVSKTGEILIGHNEDNGGRIFNPQYWVPPAKHKAGEMITYEPTAAKIPQVRETLGFYWSQTLDPNGSSFSDGFVNEAGVVIVSNACSNIFDKDQKLKDGGIGYGIRRLMAERAHSAREAVDIAIDLLGKYGYFSEGRTYTIADKNEAWQLAIHKGNTWVARRVKDNEVIYIPNNFMMDKVDATDTENVIVSPGLIERSIKNGRYKPATPGLRQLIIVDRSELYKGNPEKSLTVGLTKTGGRDNFGHVTSRRIGGGHKRKYRVIDFKRNKFDCEATVERIEYDPNRTSFIALINYEDGEKAYILAPQRLKAGDKVISSEKADIKPGNAMPLKNMPVGTVVHNVELNPGRGGQVKAVSWFVRQAAMLRLSVKTPAMHS